MTAIILSTGAVEPSSIPMWSKTPSWKDSNSIVALSVSISAKISPSFTESPTFLNHLARVPSSMVSLNLGIFIISAILIYFMFNKWIIFLLINNIIHNRLVRERWRLWKFFTFCNNIFYFFVYFFDIRFCTKFLW